MENNTPHILVVDDELSMRELLEVLLVKEGYKVTCAKNGQDAVSMINKTVFDLLLCDIRLGDITGIDVLKALKEENQDTVVIMISAYATTEAAVQAMNEGAYPFYFLPLSTVK